MNSLPTILRAVVHWLPAIGVAMLGLVLTHVLAEQQRTSVERVAQARHAEQVEAAVNAVNQRILAYTEVVAGMRDLYLVDPALDYRQFERIAAGHDVRVSYPEIRNLSFTRRVPAAGRSVFEQRMREQAEAKGYAAGQIIHPDPGPGFENLFVVEHLWPHVGNDGVWGLSIHAQPNNLASMLRAWATGVAVVSAPFSLVQERELANGFLLRFPVFTAGRGAGPSAPEFIGAIAASIHARSMMSALEDSGFLRGLALKIEDLGRVAEAEPGVTILLGTTPSWSATRADQALMVQRELVVHDRRWQLSFLPAQGLLSEQERQLPHWISAGGVLASLLLAMVASVLTRRYLLTLNAVRSTHQALERSEDRFLAVFNQAAVGISLTDSENGHFLRVNRKYGAILGYHEDELMVLSIQSLSHPDELGADEAAMAGLRASAVSEYHCEKRLRHKNGSWIWVDLTVSPVFDSVGERPWHVGVIQDISARKAAEAELQYLAYHDALTGLPNRRQLLDRLPQILQAGARRQRFGALLMFDLDHFKLLNETRGHDQGDQLLREVAARLRDENGLVVRHGDDEFILVAEDLADNAVLAAARAGALGEGVLERLRAPVQLGGKPYQATVSMGVSLFAGDELSVDELLSRADLAMHEAKLNGRNTFRFYDPALQELVNVRAALSADMQVGLEQQQFELFYQPQLEHGYIRGAEVLLRWRHPRDGLVSPATFIPLAEETGFVVELGDWVLRTACVQLAQWKKTPGFAELMLAVNVSPRQFRQADFVERVLAALASSGAEARQLKLELTEGLLLHDVDDTIDKMMRLKSYGVSFSLDDFGTGYSSLAYLKRLPLDQLKIDQSFVRDVLTDPNDAAIARTVVALATSLGLAVIAEGVETEEQLDFLERNHCHAWQGYLFSKPVPVAEFEALLVRS